MTFQKINCQTSNDRKFNRQPSKRPIFNRQRDHPIETLLEVLMKEATEFNFKANWSGCNGLD